LTLRYFIAHILESASYFVFFISLAIWSRYDRRGIIKILCGYYFTSGVLLAKAAMYAGGANGSNLYLYGILCLLSSFALGAYFYNVLNGKFSRVLVFVFCAQSAFYYLFTNIISGGHQVFDSLAYVLLAFGIIILCALYIVQLLNHVEEAPLSTNFDFWFIASQLIYFIGSFIIFLSFGYLTRKVMEDPGYSGVSRTLTGLWGLHNVLLFLSSLLTSGGVLWILYRKK
jgi:hypothetical protein